MKRNQIEDCFGNVRPVVARWLYHPLPFRGFAAYPLYFLEGSAEKDAEFVDLFSLLAEHLHLDERNKYVLFNIGYTHRRSDSTCPLNFLRQKYTIKAQVSAEASKLIRKLNSKLCLDSATALPTNSKRAREAAALAKSCDEMLDAQLFPLVRGKLVRDPKEFLSGQ